MNQPDREEKSGVQPQEKGSSAKQAETPLFYRLPGVLRVLCVVVTVILLLEGLGVFYGRDAFLAVAGPKYYTVLTRRQDFSAFSDNLAAGFTQPVRSNTYDLSVRTATNNRFLFGTQPTQKLWGRLLADMSGELKLSRNPSDGSLAASVNMNSSGRTVLDALASLTSKRLDLVFGNIANGRIYLNEGDVPEFNGLFSLPGKVEQVPVSERSVVSDELTNAAMSAFKHLSNRNFRVDRKQKVTVAGRQVTCDVIRVTLSEEQLDASLKSVFSAVNTDGELAPVKQEIFSQAGELIALIGSAEGDTLGGSVNGGYEELSKEIDTLKTGGVTVTVNVLDGLVNSQVLSVGVETGSGISFSNGFYRYRGEMTLKLPENKGRPEETVTSRYSQNSAVYNGTVALRRAGETADSIEGNFRVDTAKPLPEGLCEGTASGYVTINKLRYFTKASLNEKDGKNVLDVRLTHTQTHGGTTTATLNAAYSSSGGVLKGPAPDDTGINGGEDAVGTAQLILDVMQKLVS